MLADIGSTLLNTNEIHEISIQHDSENTETPWAIVIHITSDGNHYVFSLHSTKADACEKLEELRTILRGANCLIDLRPLRGSTAGNP